MNNVLKFDLTRVCGYWTYSLFFCLHSFCGSVTSHPNFKFESEQAKPADFILWSLLVDCLSGGIHVATLELQTIVPRPQYAGEI